ncbi:MAG TPA: toll/interleukin-1 receptor domain-containing protein [Agriterribacter sp.]|nr:toll/interleukin-1 receptor domain-containing protein [Agriterribacter sp.]
MQVTLIRAIKKLAVVWVCISVFLMLIILLQTIFGRYGNMAGSAWSWILLTVIPGNLVILSGYLKHKKLPGAMMPDATYLLYRIAYYLSFAYLLAVTAVLLLQPFGDVNKSPADKLHATDTGLLIFEGFLLIVLGLFIYKVEQWLKMRATQERGRFYEPEKDVFISYAHADKAIAHQLKQKLEKEDLQVLIDTNNMPGGYDIKKFIEECVRTSKVTLSVVSSASLTSGWVCMETINTFYLEKFLPGKKFIACYIDEDFFSPGFTSAAVQQFDEQLDELKVLIEKHNILGIDTRDLNENKTRLLSVRNNLDEIIMRLRNSLCINIRNSNLDHNFELIVKSIRQ